MQRVLRNTNPIQQHMYQPWLCDVPEKRAFMVCGPEASGNRYMTQLLIDAGCYGVAGYSQPVDGPGYRVVVPMGNHPDIAFVRSYPHARTWPDIAQIRAALWEYTLTVIVMRRDAEITAQSQVRAGHVETVGEARANIFKACRLIRRQLIATGVESIKVHYHALSPSGLRADILGVLGLRADVTTEFVDGDIKYRDH